MKLIYRVAIGVLSSVLAAACSSSSGSSAAGCTVDSECAANRVCTDGACADSGSVGGKGGAATTNQAACTPYCNILVTNFHKCQPDIPFEVATCVEQCTSTVAGPCAPVAQAWHDCANAATWDCGGPSMAQRAVGCDAQQTAIQNCLMAHAGAGDSGAGGSGASGNGTGGSVGPGGSGTGGTGTAGSSPSCAGLAAHVGACGTCERATCCDAVKACDADPTCGSCMMLQGSADTCTKDKAYVGMISCDFGVCKSACAPSSTGTGGSSSCTPSGGNCTSSIDCCGGSICNMDMTSVFYHTCE